VQEVRLRNYDELVFRILDFRSTVENPERWTLAAQSQRFGVNA